jgi:hypothetical protein
MRPLHATAWNSGFSNTDNAGDTQALNQRLTHIFHLREHAGTHRPEIEAFIRHCFADAHGADVKHFMPRLLSLRTQHEEIIAAFGLRAASSARLFLETYLDRPIEEVLESRLGVPVQRQDIIEVGNLSALYPGAARWLIVALTARLHEEGYRWVVFTGTPALKNGFSRLGLCPIELTAATLEHLPLQDRAHWGRYYDHAPKVMAGNIAHGYDALLKQRDLSAVLRTSINSIEAP